MNINSFLIPYSRSYNYHAFLLADPYPTIIDASYNHILM